MKVTLIGTGRVAFHFGHALQRAGHTVEGIVGRNTAHTTTLAASERSCPMNASTPTL
ncbi:MAG: hypothetical protein IPF64_17910 [Flavobacteriales bacterium]|nr:hypothetical protein [Flavobacteriales bacterium]